MSQFAVHPAKSLSEAEAERVCAELGEQIARVRAVVHDYLEGPPPPSRSGARIGALAGEAGPRDAGDDQP